MAHCRHASAPISSGRRRLLRLCAAVAGLHLSPAWPARVLQAQDSTFVRLEPPPGRDAVPVFVADGTPASGFQAGDRMLAQWALDAWARATDGALRLEPASEPASLLRVYWDPADGSVYGETEPLLVGGRRGAAVHVVPAAAAFGRPAESDPLMRDAIVYLTCLHETGHALGLSHSRGFADIMYSFSFGGDVAQYFQRYRSTLRGRDDIRTSSGLSAADVERIRVLYR